MAPCKSAAVKRRAGGERRNKSPNGADSALSKSGLDAKPLATPPLPLLDLLMISRYKKRGKEEIKFEDIEKAKENGDLHLILLI